MPEVKCLYNLCADKPIYEMSNYTLFGCKVNPNVITGINLFLITPLIFYNLIYNSSYIILLVLILIRVYLDILDGHIARKCKLQSRSGAIFDLFTDFVLNCGISLLLLYYVYYLGKNNIFLSVLIISIALINFYSFTTQLVQEFNLAINKNEKYREIKTAETLAADNSIILITIFILFSKFSINYLNSFNK